MLDTMRRHAVTLAAFAALTTGFSALIHQVTAPAISQQNAKQQKALLDQVVPPGLYDNDMPGECYIVTDVLPGSSAPQRLYLARSNGVPVAAALETVAPDGYSGAIQLLVGADFHGKVLGSRVLEHHETPGLGDKIDIRLSDWIERFRNQQVNGADDARWAVGKDGGMFDQFTGATITPRAVVKAIKRSALYLQTLPPRLDTLTPCGES